MLGERDDGNLRHRIEANNEAAIVVVVWASTAIEPSAAFRTVVVTVDIVDRFSLRQTVRLRSMSLPSRLPPRLRSFIVPTMIVVLVVWSIVDRDPPMATEVASTPSPLSPLARNLRAIEPALAEMIADLHQCVVKIRTELSAREARGETLARSVRRRSAALESRVEAARRSAPEVFSHLRTIAAKMDETKSLPDARSIWRDNGYFWFFFDKYVPRVMKGVHRDLEVLGGELPASVGRFTSAVRKVADVVDAWDRPVEPESASPDTKSKPR